jgi:hypothetical protein
VRFEKILPNTRAGELAFTYNGKDDTFTGPNSLRLSKITIGRKG